MLARTFMSATDLGISEVERDALIAVLYALEGGEIPDDEFHMHKYVHDCGTPSCIAGWANYFVPEAFPEVKWFGGTSSNLSNRLPRELIRLFGIDVLGVARATTRTAARVLHDYLVTGKARWIGRF